MRGGHPPRPSVSLLNQFVYQLQNQSINENNVVWRLDHCGGRTARRTIEPPSYMEAIMTSIQHTRLLDEISHDIPHDLPGRYLTGGDPLFAAYGCLLLERNAGKSYVYRAVNMETGGSVLLARKQYPLASNGLADMVDKIRLSPVAGAGRWEADRPDFNHCLQYGETVKILKHVFRDILPEYDFAIREEQIALAIEMLNTVRRRAVSLQEAEVGLGKTLAYLVVAILAKRGQLNGFYNMSLCPDMQYADRGTMPIVVSTSSIALQKALVNDYIPELSRVLLENGVLRKPIAAVVRKGREHYACDHNLLVHLPFEHDPQIKAVLKRLAEPDAPIDLSDLDVLTPHVKRTICVPDTCLPTCPKFRACRYSRLRARLQSLSIDIQVCNHNYLLADAVCRAQGRRPLLPNYQAVVIDEGHKLLPAARQIYGTELSSLSVIDICSAVNSLNFKYKIDGKAVRKTAKKLADQGRRLFRRLNENLPPVSHEEETDRLTAVMDGQTVHHLHLINVIAGELRDLLSVELPGGKYKLRDKLRWNLKVLSEKTGVLCDRRKLIYWLEKTDAGAFTGRAQECTLRAIPKNLDEHLYRDIWGKSIPVILTSGTLSARGDFTHIKRTLGLERVSRLSESCKLSPYNHRDHALLYISEIVPFPNMQSGHYVESLTSEIERLIYAAHGHTAVLFTSYKALGMVHAELKHRNLPFPLFHLERGGTAAIERCKQSAGGVLFASGSLWEGIDIPGDALSQLIIVKLPFAAPDPIGEYERSFYTDFNEYKQCVIVPDMLLKLKQGFGRLIRSETDTGVVAILDSRLRVGEKYREQVLDVLPPCAVTSDIERVASFIRSIKSPDYFDDTAQLV
jgi:ATP-dependent DNA helicase DinG